MTVARARGWNLSFAIGQSRIVTISTLRQCHSRFDFDVNRVLPQIFQRDGILLHVHFLYHRIHSVQLCHSLSFVWYILFHPPKSWPFCVGGLVHGEIAQRSRFLFSKQHDPKNMAYPDGYATAIARWLERHDGSIVAGSYMPDWYCPLLTFS